MNVRDVIARNLTVNRTNQGAGIKISEPYETVRGNVTNGKQSSPHPHLILILIILTSSSPHPYLILSATWDGITIINPRAAALYVNVFEEDAQAGKPYGCVMPNASVLAKDGSWMSASSVVFRRIGVRDNTALGACFNCAPGTPCDIDIADSESRGVFLCHNVRGTSVEKLCGEE